MSASRWRDEHGMTMPFIALLISTLILMVSFAVDLGRQRSDRRLAQAGADVIALDMMRVVDGRTVDELVADQLNVYAALSASAARNGFINELGYVGSPDPHEPRVTALQWGTITAGGDGDTFQVASGTTVPNAVKITTKRTTDYYFQPGENSVTRTAIAALPQPIVSLEVGSVAAGFQPGYPVASATLDVMVQVRNRTFHRQFNASTPNPTTAFDLVGYRGLAAAEVDVWRIASNAGFASPNEMLQSQMTAGQFFDATASALDQQAAAGDPNAANGAAELRRFRTSMGVDSTGTMELDKVMSFEQGGDEAAAEGSINVLNLLSGAANVINGQNFASYTFNPGIPGVASVDVDQYVVHTPGWARGGVGTQADNSQVRFKVTLNILPLTGMLATTPTTIPLVIEAANATGVVESLNCADPQTGSEAGIHVVTSAATAKVGTTTNLSAGTVLTTPGVIVQSAASFGSSPLNVNVFLALGLSALQIASLDLNAALTASAAAAVGQNETDHVFLTNAPPVASQRSPGGVGATTLEQQLLATFTASQGSSVLSSTATTALKNQLNYAFTSLQDLIIDPLLQQAGVAVAGADVRSWDMDCSGAGLKLVG